MGTVSVPTLRVRKTRLREVGQLTLGSTRAELESRGGWKPGFAEGLGGSLALHWLGPRPHTPSLPAPCPHSPPPGPADQIQPPALGEQLTAPAAETRMCLGWRAGNDVLGSGSGALVAKAATEGSSAFGSGRAGLRGEKGGGDFQGFARLEAYFLASPASLPRPLGVDGAEPPWPAWTPLPT